MRPLQAAVFVCSLSLFAASACALSTSSAACGVSAAPKFLPLPRCAPTNKTLDDAKRVAWQFAPVVYHHPLEKYHLIDPREWYNASELYLQDLRPTNESIFAWFTRSSVDEVMFQPRSFRTVLNSSRLTPEQQAAVIAGAPYAGNRSTAKVMYTVEEVYSDGARTQKVPGLWVFSYNLYYSWNGCSNQEIAISLNGEQQVVPYLVCPIGVHEGDWERVSVLVCAEDLSLQQASYSQHGWWETRDCTVEGQCPREQNENDPAVLNPVTYIGLESHANYFESSPLMVYAWKNASFNHGRIQLDNFGGLWVGDRTLSDKTSKFVPTPENVVFLPNITQLEAAGVNNSPEWEWAIYPGNWGAPLQDGTTTFACFDANQTALQECPDSQATRSLRTAFKLLDTVQGAMGKESAATGTAGYEGEVFKIQSASNNSWVPHASITGPLYRMWSYQWLPQRASPIFSSFNSSDVVICPSDSLVTRSYPDYSGALSPSTSINTIVDYLVGMCVGSIITSTFFILVMMVPSLISKAAAAPSKLLAKGSEAWAAGRSRLKKGGKALVGATDASPAKQGDGRQPRSSQIELLRGESVGALAGALSPFHDGSASVAVGGVAVGATADPAAGAAAPSPGAHASASSKADLAPAASAASAASSLPAEEVEVVLSEEGEGHANTPLYLLWAVACYAIAVVLLALGTDSFVHNSVSALATGVIGQSAPVEAVKWLIIGSLILAGVCDLFAVFIVLLATREHFTVWKWSFRNWLHSHWVERHTFKLHIVTAGLVILVLSISCILFGLGLVVMTVQLAARVACSTLADVNINDFRVADVCVSVQSLSEEPICGWQALEVCYNVTNMRVLLISLGAMLLLWSHIIWLVLLLLSMWRYKEWRLVVPRAQVVRRPPVPSGAMLERESAKHVRITPDGSEAAALEPEDAP